VAEPQSLDDEERTWTGSTGESHAGSRGLRAQLIVSNRYRIGALLGAGGMGLVYEAEHIGLGLSVALKVLRPELIEREGMVARFRQEARCTATLSGEHIVRVLDEGRLETGLPFFIMERLHGLDLRAVLQACSSLPVRILVDYARQTCAALAEAHAAGIIHRDVKPSNLFVTSQGGTRSRIKLLDFGIAQRAASNETGERLGTSSYASPEHLAAPDQIDASSDLWSLGIVMFEALTGALPVAAGWFGRRRLDLRPLDARRDVPDRLRLVIRRCLTEDKSKRFLSAADLARELEPFAVGERAEPASPALHRRRVPTERRCGRDRFGQRAGLGRDALVLRAFHPPRRARMRPRPTPHGSIHRA